MQRFSIDQHIPNWFTVSNKKILTLKDSLRENQLIHTGASQRLVRPRLALVSHHCGALPDFTLY